MKSELIVGDCLDALSVYESNTVDLVYLDPPFFTDKVQRLTSRDSSKEFAYDDLWNSENEYAQFLGLRIEQARRVLKDSGSIFIHCDKNATHIVRGLLDRYFGQKNFQSEIIWTYRRWSNSKKGLLPAHQTIYFYSKTADFFFNTIFGEYSESTNVDQILQSRTRDGRNKSVYLRDSKGDVVQGKEKKGVPLSDVWDMPYLNPKAKERVGYPTQKPVLLLERIINIASPPGGVVLDPFCGSGTTLVAAQLLGRSSIGIDCSEEAVELARSRLEYPTKSESAVLQKGRQAYRNADPHALSALLGADIIPVQRNSSIDAIMKEQYLGGPVLVRVQRPGECINELSSSLVKAATKKGAHKCFLIRTELDESLFGASPPDGIYVVDSPALAIQRLLNESMGGTAANKSLETDA